MTFLPTGLVAAAWACFSLALPAASQAAAPDFAPIMPLAAQSLLLDITAAGDRLVTVGERGHILYSDDNGRAWQQAKVPTTRMLTGVHFVDHRRGWAVGHDGLILVSDDGGMQWRIQRDGLAVQQQANLESREIAYRRVEQLTERLAMAAGEAAAQIEVELEDAQMELEDADLVLEEAVFTSPLMDIWFQDTQRGWATGAFGTLVATRDAGQHWTNQGDVLDNPDELHLNAITGDGKGRVFIAGEGGIMFRSHDGGLSWESLQPFYEGSWFGTVYCARTDTLFVFGLRGNLYRSGDFGTHWEPVPVDSNHTLAGGSASPAGDVVLVGAAGAVLASSDGGQSFHRKLLVDRLSLSSGISHNGDLILVGQGGVKVQAREHASHAR